MLDELCDESQFQDPPAKSTDVEEDKKKDDLEDLFALSEEPKLLKDATTDELLNAYWQTVQKNLGGTLPNEIEAMTGFICIMELENSKNFRYQVTFRGSPALVRGMFCNLADFVDDTFDTANDDGDDDD